MPRSPVAGFNCRKGNLLPCLRDRSGGGSQRILKKVQPSPGGWIVLRRRETTTINGLVPSGKEWRKALANKDLGG